MKDRIGRHVWWNHPVKNPFTTREYRFKAQPWGLLMSPFMQDRLKFDNKLKTRYLELME